MTLARLATQSDPRDDHNGSALRNWWFVPAEGVGEGEYLQASGLKAVTSTALRGAVRAMIRTGGQTYVLAGGGFYVVTDAGAVTTVSTALVDDPQSSIATNGISVAFAVNNILYHYDIAGNSLTTPNVQPMDDVTAVAFHNQRYVAVGRKAGSTREDIVAASDLLDGTTWQALAFGVAEADPDAARHIASVGGNLWVFGGVTTELWYDAGASPMPFVPQVGAVIRMGIRNAACAVATEGGLVWLGPDCHLYTSGGGAPVQLTTPAIGDKLRAGTEHRLIYYTDKGHKFVAVRMQGQPAWVLNLTTRLWSERATGAADGAWLATAACPCLGTGRTFCGGSDGHVYVLDADTYADGGDVLRRVCTMAPVNRGEAPIFPALLSVDFHTGQHDLGREPEAFLRVSRNGRTWSDWKGRKMGAVGNYTRLTRWSGLGRFRRFQGEIAVTDPIKAELSGMTLA